MGGWVTCVEWVEVDVMIVVSDDECTVIDRGIWFRCLLAVARADILADNGAKLDPATIPTSSSSLQPHRAPSMSVPLRGLASGCSEDPTSVI